MAKFNVVQKQRRAVIQDYKRAAHGDPSSGKLKQRALPVAISGKRKQKLNKKWRREQKEAIEKGLVTMEDVEMAAAEGSSRGSNEKPKFHMKKASKLKIKRLKGKGKGKKKSSNPVPAERIDAMVE